MLLEITIIIIFSVYVQGLLFKVLHSEWPETYFYIQDSPTDYWISRHPLKYLFFRLSPSFIACWLAGLVLSYGNRPILIPCVLIGTLHWGLTSGRRFLQIFRGCPENRRSLGSVFNVVLLLPIVVVAAGAGIIGKESAVLEDFFQDRWLFQVMVAVVLSALWLRWKHFLQKDQLGHEDIFHRSKEEIPLDLWQYATTYSAAHEVDPLLVHAIMIIENTQRPSWFRRVEHAVGRFTRKGSYGIMQVQNNRPLNDMQSIELATSILLRLQQRYPTFDDIVSRYNGSSNYAYNTRLAYEWLQDHDPEPGKSI